MDVFNSVDEITETNRKLGIEVEYSQLSSGQYVGTFPAQKHGHSTFGLETTSVDIAARGQLDHDTYFIAAGDERLKVAGISEQQEKFVVYPPGSEIFLAARRDCRCSLMYIPASRVEQYIRANDLDSLPKSRQGPFTLPVAETVSRSIRSTIASLALTANPADDIAQQAEQRTLDQLAQAEFFGREQFSPRERGRPNARYTTSFRRALEYVNENLKAPLDLVEFSIATGISSRTLRRMFDAHIGVSPGKFVQIKKLNAIRQELEHATSSEVTVSTIAMRYHFNHLGRFAAAYYQLFGEYPRETLSRNQSGRQLNRPGFPGDCFT